MDKQKDSWNGSPATNQGPSSDMDPSLKSAVLIPATENQEGNESGPSVTAGFGAPTGKIDNNVNYSIKDVNTFNAELPAYINITASTEDQRPLRSTGAVKQDVPEAGQGQYQ